MRKFLTLALLAVLGTLLLVFLVANRQTVTISMDPVSVEDPALAVQLPMWAALVVTLFLGYGLGALGMWISDGGLRRRARERKAEIKRLKAELKVAATGMVEGDSQAVALRGQSG